MGGEAPQGEGRGNGGKKITAKGGSWKYEQKRCQTTLLGLFYNRRKEEHPEKSEGGRKLVDVQSAPHPETTYIHGKVGKGKETASENLAQ